MPTRSGTQQFAHEIGARLCTVRGLRRAGEGLPFDAVLEHVTQKCERDVCLVFVHNVHKLARQHVCAQERVALCEERKGVLVALERKLKGRGAPVERAIHGVLDAQRTSSRLLVACVCLAQLSAQRCLIFGPYLPSAQVRARRGTRRKAGAMRAQL